MPIIRIGIGGDRLDLPVELQSLDNYSATLAHKVDSHGDNYDDDDDVDDDDDSDADDDSDDDDDDGDDNIQKVQHSFQPNCELWEAEHPVYGLLPCVRYIVINIIIIIIIIIIVIIIITITVTVIIFMCTLYTVISS